MGRSKWCPAEFLLAHSLNKRIFAAVIEPTSFDGLPIEMTAEWQIVDLAADNQNIVSACAYRRATAVPRSPSRQTVSNGWRSAQAGWHRRTQFSLAPQRKPGRTPYRGLRRLEAHQAGNFFGCEAIRRRGDDRLAEWRTQRRRV